MQRGTHASTTPEKRYPACPMGTTMLETSSHKPKVKGGQSHRVWFKWSFTGAAETSILTASPIRSGPLDQTGALKVA